MKVQENNLALIKCRRCSNAKDPSMFRNDKNSETGKVNLCKQCDREIYLEKTKGKTTKRLSSPKKIEGELAERVLALHGAGHNNNYIAKLIGSNRSTVDTFLTKNGLTKNYRQDVLKKDAYQDFLKEVLADGGKNWSITRKKYKISFKKAKDLALQAGIEVRSFEYTAEERRLTIEEAQKRVPKGHGTVIGFDGKKYVVRREDGSEYRKGASRLNQGDPKSKCGFAVTLEELKQRLKTMGYTYNYGFKKTKSVISATHDACGFERITRYVGFKNKDCPRCSNSGISKQETELSEWISSMGVAIERFKFEKAGAGRKKEIDIYIPSLKLGIEYCGLYWHSSDNSKSNFNRHYQKMLDASAQGIRLITIWDKEWKERPEQVKSFLRSTLQLNERKIYARNCYVKVIELSVAREFLDQYHLQGSDPSPYLSIGLFCKNELVGVMNFGRHPRKEDDKGVSCLTRLCFKENTTIVGGASKMFSYAKTLLKSKDYTSIISWSDNRWSDGGVYKALGFYLSRPMRSNGSYMGLTDGSIWPERLIVYKNEFIGKEVYKRLIANGTAKEEDFAFIWDCGKKRWIYTL